MTSVLRLSHWMSAYHPSRPFAAVAAKGSSRSRWTEGPTTLLVDLYNEKATPSAAVCHVRSSVTRFQINRDRG
jgi:hypothetical protein